MQISEKLNRCLHATASKAGISHEELKGYVAKKGILFDFLTTKQACKLIDWMNKGINNGDVYRDGRWVKKGNLTPVERHSRSIPLLGVERPCLSMERGGTVGRGDVVDPNTAMDEYEYVQLKDQADRALEMASTLGQKYDNRKLKMSKGLSVALHKKVSEKGWSHADLLKIAQEEFGTYFNRLSDAQGWYLYYLFDGNLSMMDKWRNIIKEQG